MKSIVIKVESFSMRAKVLGMLICCFQLLWAGCQQKPESTPQSTVSQNTSQSAVTQQATENPSVNVPTSPAPSATASPGGAASPGPLSTNEQQTSASNVSPRPAEADACALLQAAEVQRVQGESVRETKGSNHTSEAFAVTQCFYGTATFSNSINLEVTRLNQSKNDRLAMREFWNQKFHQNADEEREREKEREKEGDREANKPELVKGIGDEAFWVKSAVGGSLYVLKNNALLRLSIGGKETERIKIRKAKALALKAVNRL
jgi:hypothetical protein